MTRAANRITTELVRRLEAQASPATKAWWTRYLKGTATFRGVPMAGVRAIVDQLVRDHGLDARPVDERLDLAAQWLACTTTEDQLAGVLLLAEHALGELRDDHQEALAAPLVRGDLANWSIVDWYGVKVAGPWLEAALPRTTRARAVLAWSKGEGLWLRRTAVVAFTRVAPGLGSTHPSLVKPLLAACANNLVSSERFAHTGPGWLLRELSGSAPDRVRAFVDEHPELSNEARRMALARLTPPTSPGRRRAR